MAGAPGGGGNFANNPPPPNYAMGGMGGGGFRSDSGMDGPAPRPATYQPGTAGQYGGANSSYYGNNDTNAHSYEYEQQARMDADAAEKGGAQSPPGYNVESAGPNLYAPPSGPPPTGATGNFASPAGPPPGK
jgi:hypothetical protein